MTNITDELREFIETHLYLGATALGGWKEAAFAIADRIDAEHEEAIQQALMGDGGVPATDENMAKCGWVRLPVDADGEYIHIGDVMVYADNTKPMEVVALVPPAVFLTEDGPRYADICRHYHAPTVEDVLRKFAEKITDSQIPGVHPTYEEVIAEYAAKLRLAEVDK